MTNIKKNYIYNLLYQVLIIIIPLITAPYLARVIGVTGSGIYSYTYSIVYYFMLVAMLGINNYGNRTIAKTRDDKEKLSNSFFEIYKIQLIMTIIMFILYLIFICFFASNYKNIFILQSLHLISVAFDINWFFQGMEDFKIVITRNTIVKFFTLIAIFVFVKSTNDLWKYTLILSLGTLLGQIISWKFLKKYIVFKKVKLKNAFKHFKNIIVLFIPAIAISIYQIMDKIMLGSMANVAEVGLYEYSQKIVSIPLSIILTLGTVMMPQMSNLISNGKLEKCKEYIGYSLKFQIFIALPFTLGIIAISHDFIPLYLGDGFQNCIIMVCCLISMVPFVAWQTVLKTQYLLPMSMDKKYIICTFCGAIVNSIVNILLIPRYGGLAACVSTVAAEFVVMLYITLTLRKKLPINLYLKMIVPFVIKSFLMFAIIYSFCYLNISPIIRIILQIVVGGTIYFILNIKYIKTLFDYEKCFKNLVVKFKFKKGGCYEKK